MMEKYSSQAATPKAPPSTPMTPHAKKEAAAEIDIFSMAKVLLGMSPGQQELAKQQLRPRVVMTPAGASDGVEPATVSEPDAAIVATPPAPAVPVGLARYGNSPETLTIVCKAALSEALAEATANKMLCSQASMEPTTQLCTTRHDAARRGGRERAPKAAVSSLEQSVAAMLMEQREQLEAMFEAKLAAQSARLEAKLEASVAALRAT